MYMYPDTEVFSKFIPVPPAEIRIIAVRSTIDSKYPGTVRSKI